MQREVVVRVEIEAVKRRLMARCRDCGSSSFSLWRLSVDVDAAIGQRTHLLV
jgi:hypothetical protein